jgi:hypothetical protein
LRVYESLQQTHETTSTEPSTDLGILHQIVELGSKLTNPGNLLALAGDDWGVHKIANFIFW